MKKEENEEKGFTIDGRPIDPMGVVKLVLTVIGTIVIGFLAFVAYLGTGGGKKD